MADENLLESTAFHEGTSIVSKRKASQLYPQVADADRPITMAGGIHAKIRLSIPEYQRTDEYGQKMEALFKEGRIPRTMSFPEFINSFPAFGLFRPNSVKAHFTVLKDQYHTGGKQHQAQRGSAPRDEVPGTSIVAHRNAPSPIPMVDADRAVIMPGSTDTNSVPRYQKAGEFGQRMKALFDGGRIPRTMTGPEFIYAFPEFGQFKPNSVKSHFNELKKQYYSRKDQIQYHRPENQARRSRRTEVLVERDAPKIGEIPQLLPNQTREGELFSGVSSCKLLFVTHCCIPI